MTHAMPSRLKSPRSSSNGLRSGLARPTSHAQGSQEAAERRRRLELRDQVEFLERRRKRIGEAPQGAWFELGVFRIEIEVVYSWRQMFRHFEVRLDERSIDNQLRPGVGELLRAPTL